MTDNIHVRFKLAYDGFDLDVDLDLPGRGVTALFGQSGSGKTTLLRCVAGLTRAQGELTVNGEVWQNEALFVPTHQRPLGYVFQDANLFAHLTVRRNLEYGLKRVSSSERKVGLDQAIELLGIGHLLERMPARLSGGEQQRVGIARALAVSPRLLLMDEPLAALDLARRQEVLPYLETLHDELDMPVLYVSHAPDEVARLADHLVVMDAGRAVASGAITETLARLDLPIRLGEDVGVVLQGEIGALDAQWHLARIHVGAADLWVRDPGLPVGRRVRVRILARDVSLALQRVEGTSILNTLPAVVTELAGDSHPALALVRLDIGGAPLLARVTQRSAAALNLAPGQILQAQIKAVAVIG